ncbi:MAG: hypothetical protein AAF823_06680 [Planctomycetota bacterium]
MTAGLFGGATAAQSSEWVRQGQTGLIYQMDSRGDRVLDYTAAGYYGGTSLPDTLALVDPSAVIHVAPIAGDNRASIQAAIDQVEAMPVNANGYRGVVQLQAGQYDIGDGLTIQSSGVILRGVGDGANASVDTILRSTSTDQINLITVANSQSYANNLFGQGDAVGIVDKVVPAGATSFRVADTSGLAVGDWVNVKHTPSQAWFDAVSTDFNNDPSGENWGWNPSNDRFTTQHERRVTRIEGDRVFIDAPLSHSIDSRLATGTVEHYVDHRVDHVGIENIRGTSVFDATETDVVSGRTVFVDEDHASSFIQLAHAEEAWVRNVTAQHMKDSAVVVGSVSRSITVEDARYIEPVSIVTGGRRYAFNMNGGSRVLMRDLEADSARRAFINNSTFNGFNRGPNVFVDGVATNSFVRSGPHAGYSTGALYDNLADDGGFEARRAFSPEVHGWRGAHAVLWNSDAGPNDFQIVNPPFARNFVIGGVGDFGTGNADDGTVDSPGQRIAFNDPENPLDSLYVQQMLENERNPFVVRREYVIGDFDQFEADGPGSADDVYVDPDWLAAVEDIDGWRAGFPVAGFDDPGINRLVPFSFRFELDPGDTVVSAVLTLATRRLGSHSDNDVIHLEGLTDADRILSSSRDDWGMTFDDDLQVRSIELFGDLSYLQDGLLNVLVSDDRPVDWAHLRLNVEQTASNLIILPEPSTACVGVLSCWCVVRRPGRRVSLY